MLFSIRDNPLLLTDAYNLSHSHLKCNVDWEVSHIYNRTAPMVLCGFNEAVLNTLSITVEDWMVKEAEHCAQQMGLTFPTELWMRVVNELKGNIPLHVESLLDGTWVPKGTPFAQIQNTVEGFGELVTWWEALFLHAWFPSACATEAFRARKYLLETQKKYGYDDSFLLRFHSFGFRGHRSLEDAYWAGTAWNLFLQGTDDFHTFKHTPNADISSISALAHKVTQQFNTELECYMHTIDATVKAGEKIVAIVIDTYDAERFIDRFAVQIANYAAQHEIKVIFRPDSGDVINQAMELYTKCVEVNNCKNTGVIIGMDMSFERAKDYDAQLRLGKVPLDYVSYGIGAGYYKHLERDTLGWSMKTAYSNNRPRMKFSNDPIKQSIPGIVDLMYDADGKLIVFTRDEAEKFEDYDFLKQYTTLYFCDTETQDWEPLNWNETHSYALDIDNSQQTIILSNGIKTLTEEIRSLYGLDLKGNAE